ncbi:hypothetical protein MNBD_GAMMA17-1955 [hydrothermal vent metagenome]|uniref:Uncharacterized protein n=1 Tax=hydrothermal vent metagenome TaxID=652676 RepID=A0A3B1A7Z9_9ZZZZ
MLCEAVTDLGQWEKRNELYPKRLKFRANSPAYFSPGGVRIPLNRMTIHRHSALPWKKYSALFTPEFKTLWVYIASASEFLAEMPNNFVTR